ncbi:MAG: RdgB/HAM1 family non-canonical purine NTP pyrophosphatase [Chthonomonadales bacterium]
MSYPREIVVATRNPKKGGEMVAILGATNIKVRTLAEFPEADIEVEETGSTFAENAELKARSAMELTGRVCIADDGGLIIDALGGQPGLHSKRFLGEDTSFPDKMAHILKLMQDVSEADRTCRFFCAVSIAVPNGRIIQCEGACEAHIGHEMRGTNGFGYDPIVVVNAVGKHMAELTPEEKHKISHRGKALACAAEQLKELFP